VSQFNWRSLASAGLFQFFAARAISPGLIIEKSIKHFFDELALRFVWLNLSVVR